MKRSERIVSLLKDRLRSAKTQLTEHEANLKKVRELPILARNDEFIATETHAIGYLNAVIYENELFLSLWQMTDDEINQYLDKRQKIEEANKKNLERMMNDIVDRQKNKTNKKNDTKK